MRWGLRDRRGSPQRRQKQGKATVRRAQKRKNPLPIWKPALVSVFLLLFFFSLPFDMAFTLVCRPWWPATCREEASLFSSTHSQPLLRTHDREHRAKQLQPSWVKFPRLPGPRQTSSLLPLFSLSPPDYLRSAKRQTKYLLIFTLEW